MLKRSLVTCMRLAPILRPPCPGGVGQVKALGDPVTVLQSAVLPKRHHNSLFIRGY